MMITPESAEFLRLFGWYKSHVLPFGGGLYDQPNAFIEAMQIIEARWAMIEAERAQDGDSPATYQD